jgi:hypothetical protein
MFDIYTPVGHIDGSGCYRITYRKKSQVQTVFDAVSAAAELVKVHSYAIISEKSSGRKMKVTTHAMNSPDPMQFKRAVALATVCFSQ